MKSVAFLCLGILTSVQAATIAVIDSGVDFNHSLLRPHAWTNPQSANNLYEKVVHGWNFSENNSILFDQTQFNPFSPELKRFIDITVRNSKGLVSTSELEWAREKSKDKNFLQNVSRYGSYIHGTHVAGIASRESDNKIMAIKIMKTSVAQNTSSNEKSLLDPVSLSLTVLAQKNISEMKKVGQFVNKYRADVANASFGITINEANKVVDKLYQLIYRRYPTEKEKSRGSIHLLKESIRLGEDFVKQAPKTLFVFAAGNDGLSNDVIPVYPANLKKENTITVAATYEDLALASFSNYGVGVVDVAAPGVAIRSSVPGDDYIHLSGTSQAAPFVTNVAGKIKDTNPELNPGQIKQILIGTVDKKSFLKDKVTSGGIVNKQRAIFAAQMSKIVPVSEAIERSLVAVGPKGLEKNFMAVELDEVVPVEMPGLFE
jgi:cell wall-associated protease